MATTLMTTAWVKNLNGGYDAVKIPISPLRKLNNDAWSDPAAGQVIKHKRHYTDLERLENG